jgi:phosphatidyl-myo-inositol dimannoside synthase
MRRRILWVSAQLPPEVGGIQQYNREILARLSRTEEVHVACAPGQRVEECRTVASHALRFAGGAPSERAWRRVQVEMRALVDAVAPEHVHFGDAGAAALAGALPAGVRSSATIHGNDLSSPWMQCGDRPAMQEIVRGLNRCACVVAVSEHTASLARASGVEVPVRVIHSGCDLERFRPQPVDRERLLRSFALPVRLPLVLTVGRLVARKGHSTVMAALVELRRPVSWISIGTGPRRRRLVLQKWLRGPRRRVRFVDHVPDARLVDLYNACDLFVLVPEQRPSPAGVDSEGFGLVYREAGACGRPVIGADAAGCREAVIHGETGLLVPPNDPRALAAAMARLLADPDHAARLGRAGREQARATGTWERTAALLLACITEEEGTQCASSITRSTARA